MAMFYLLFLQQTDECLRYIMSDKLIIFSCLHLTFLLFQCNIYMQQVAFTVMEIYMMIYVK